MSDFTMYKHKNRGTVIAESPAAKIWLRNMYPNVIGGYILRIDLEDLQAIARDAIEDGLTVEIYE